MLPDGFKWAPRWQYDEGDNAIYLDGELIAFMDQRVDGRWRARLDVHKSLDHPLVLRQCTSRESGRAGCEIWVMRHEARLREEAAVARASRPCNRWAARSS